MTMVFVAHWFIGGGVVRLQPRSTAKALLWGTAGGVTTVVAHSGGPPIAMYLLPLGLPKAAYAGTTSIVFSAINFAKAAPWLVLGRPGPALWTLMALCLPAVPIGIHAGWLLHERLSQQQLYRACYGLLVVTSFSFCGTACAAIYDESANLRNDPSPGDRGASAAHLDPR
jgi:uncharacterized protein